MLLIERLFGTQGIKRFEHDFEGFDSRNASESHLAFADGDIPKNKACSVPVVSLPS